MLEIRDCDNYETAKELIVEYSKIKGAESCFVSLDKELADLGSFYEGGALLIGHEQGIPVATVALKRLGDTSAEVKRLYVKPECRGKGYARILLEELLSRCKKLGCKEVTLTTKPDIMGIAHALYKKVGFEESERSGGTVSMKLVVEK